MLSDPEPAPAEAVPGPVLGLPPEVAEVAPDASAAAAPSAVDPAAVVAEITAEATAEPTAEAPATLGPSQVA